MHTRVQTVMHEAVQDAATDTCTSMYYYLLAHMSTSGLVTMLVNVQKGLPNPMQTCCVEKKAF